MSRVVDDLDDREEVRELFKNFQAQLPALEALLTQAERAHANSNLPATARSASPAIASRRAKKPNR